MPYNFFDTYVNDCKKKTYLMCICDVLMFIILSDHVQTSVCLLGSNLNVHTKPEKLRVSQDRIGI
jgi:hypothetical protein